MANGRDTSTAVMPPSIRWGSVFAGAIVGLAVVYLLNSFWVALADGSDAVARNLHWYGLVSALVGLLLGGLIAGWMTGIGGFGPGFMNGLTVWALILVGTLTVGVPSALAVFDITAAPLDQWGAGAAWASFWSILGGLIAAVVGGVLGGGLPKPGWASADLTEKFDRSAAAR